MQRPRQQALMFLLGAVLVGGVLGFSADRVMRHENFAKQWGSRTTFYDDLGLNASQRGIMDSLIEEQNCEIQEVLRPVQPRLDSIRSSFKAQRNRVLTSAQLGRLEAHRREHEAQGARSRSREQRQCAKP